MWYDISFNRWRNWVLKKTATCPSTGVLVAQLLRSKGDYALSVPLFSMSSYLMMHLWPFSYLLPRSESQDLLTTGFWGCRQDSWGPYTAASHHSLPGHSAAGQAQLVWTWHWAPRPGPHSSWMWGHSWQACMGNAHHQILQESLLLGTELRSPFVSPGTLC